MEPSLCKAPLRLAPVSGDAVALGVGNRDLGLCVQEQLFQLGAGRHFPALDGFQLVRSQRVQVPCRWAETSRIIPADLGVSFPTLLRDAFHVPFNSAVKTRPSPSVEEGVAEGFLQNLAQRGEMLCLHCLSGMLMVPMG